MPAEESADIPHETVSRFRDTATHLIHEYATEVSKDLLLQDTYVIGSYGAAEATTLSDLDIVFIVGGGGDETATDQEADQLEARLRATATSPAPDARDISIDPVVQPASAADAYLARACSLGQYTTVYDVEADTYRSIGTHSD